MYLITDAYETLSQTFKEIMTELWIIMKQGDTLDTKVNGNLSPVFETFESAVFESAVLETFHTAESTWSCLVEKVLGCGRIS